MCHRQHHRHRTSTARQGAPAAPSPAPPAGPVRAGDADRERVVEALGVHATAGRLDADEHERRLEAVYAATYLSDLDAALAELPPLSRAALPRRPSRPAHPTPGACTGPRLAVLLAAVAVLLVVTNLTGVFWLWFLMWPVAVAASRLGGPRRSPSAAT